jgi:hypothetical protein
MKVKNLRCWPGGRAFRLLMFCVAKVQRACGARVRDYDDAAAAQQFKHRQWQPGSAWSSHALQCNGGCPEWLCLPKASGFHQDSLSTELAHCKKEMF